MPPFAITSAVGLGFLQAFSFGILAPMLSIAQTEYFARAYNGGVYIDCGKFPHTDACRYGSTQASWTSSICSSGGSIVMVLLSPIIGQASDVYGRRPFLIVSQWLRLGIPFSVVLFLQWQGPIAPFYILRFIDSAFGTISVFSAYVADLVSVKNRAAAFGLLSASRIVGFCVSSGLAPLFARSHLLHIAAVIFVLRVIWATFFLPESLSAEKRSMKTFRSIEHPIRGMAILGRSQLFRRLTCLIALTTFIASGLSQIQMFFLNTVIGFDANDLAHIMLLGGIISIFSQTFLLKPAMDSVHEKGCIVIGMFCNIFQCLGFAVSAIYPYKWIIFASSLSDLGSFSFAAISSLKSINCSPEEQGRLQGAIYGARAIFDAIGSIIFAALYSLMEGNSVYARMLPFIISIVLYFVCIYVAQTLPVGPSNKHPPPSPSFAESFWALYDVEPDYESYSSDDDDDSKPTDALLPDYSSESIKDV